MNDYYEVERIITRKNKGKNKKYLIKWEGYPIKDCTWEPLSHLNNIPSLVEDFENNFPNSVDRRYLRKYLRISHKKRKKHFIKSNYPKFKNIKNNNHIIINLDEFKIIPKEKDTDELNKYVNIETKEEKSNCSNRDTNLNESSKENNHITLIKPIIIW